MPVLKQPSPETTIENLTILWKLWPRINSSKNDISNNKDFCGMIVKAILESWLSKSRIFHIKKNGFDIKNLIQLNDLSLSFFRSVLSKKRRIKSIKRKYREIVALGIVNGPLIIPDRLTKTCSDSTNQPIRVQNQMFAQDSDLESINRIVLWCQNRHKNILREVPWSRSIECLVHGRL